MASSTIREKEEQHHGGSSSSGSTEHVPARKACTTLGDKKFVAAFCPVSGDLVDETGVHADTPQVRLSNGQRVFLCSSDCAERFRGDIRKYIAQPGERFCETPDMLGQNVTCPECKAASGHLKVCESTPRILFRYGQTIYFNSHACLSSFIKSPSFMGSSITTMVLGEARLAGLTAVCPVSGKKFNVDDKAHMVEFKYGQRIYTCGASCPLQLMRNITGYLRPTTESYVHPPHPSVCGLMQMCPTCAHALTIDEELTPRIQFKGGQNLYFHTNACADEFSYAPHKYLVPIATEPVAQSTVVTHETAHAVSPSAHTSPSHVGKAIPAAPSTTHTTVVTGEVEERGSKVPLGVHQPAATATTQPKQRK